ncbi:MAG: sulfatase [Verrucomicrobiota bacterium]
MNRPLKLVSIFIGILGCPVVAALPATECPNVLFIMCDDLNDWALHPADHPEAITPNMDRLREQSVNFTNAHVVIPVCGPSRKILFSGLYPHTFQSYAFKSWKAEKILRNCVPLPLHFRNHGYSVYGTGKLLHEGKGGDFYDDYGIGVDYGPWSKEGEGKGKTSWVHPRLEAKYGNSIRHQDFSYGPLSEVPTWSPDRKNAGPNGWFYKGGKAFRYESETDRDLMPDEISANYAVNILRQTHDKPFYLAVGFARPHTPLYAPKKFFDMYPIESITLPPTLEGDLDDCAEALRKRWVRSYDNFDKIIELGGEDLWKEWLQAYLACVSFVDHQLGTVLDALEKSPHADNTIIVFTSDHGYHIGEKGAKQKWHLWEESTRVPYFIHLPGGKGNGKDCPHPVTTIDLYPTLADLCGLPLDPNTDRSGIALDGHSLRPFLADPLTKQWSGPSVAYMAVGKSFQDAKGWGLEPHHSVRSERYRYTLCQNGEEELYDHENDPHEWTNLAADPEYAEVKKDLKASLVKLLGKEHSD